VVGFFAHGGDQAASSAVLLIREGERLKLRTKKLRIEVLTGPNAGLMLEVPGDDARIGTGRGCHVLLFDPAVSQHHLTLRASSDGVRVSDGGSRNGTLLDGVRIRDAYARPEFGDHDWKQQFAPAHARRIRGRAAVLARADRRLDRPERRDAADLHPARTRGGDRRSGADRRRNRNQQGARGGGDPRGEPARRRSVRGVRLLRGFAESDRERAVRTRARAWDPTRCARSTCG
jgi:hypothetical protein